MNLFYQRQRRSNGNSSERLDFAERFLSDGIQICKWPDAMASIDVDMSVCETLLSAWRNKNFKGGLPALLVRAAAIVLAKHPQLHVLQLGYRRIYPKHVDIGLSVVGETFVAPVLVLREADTKSAETIAAEIAQRIPQVREQDKKMRKALRRSGWILPISFLRRALLRFLIKQYWFKTQGAGTFQITCLPDVQFFIPYRFSTSVIMAAGDVHPRVVPGVDGPVVKPMLTLTCSFDHVAWDGMCASLFLRSVKKVLETGSFDA